MTEFQPPPTRWQARRAALVSYLAPAPAPPALSLASPISISVSAKEDPITIACISDTHSTTFSVPAADMLIHAGDATGHGTAAEMQAQLDWLNTLPHAHKLLIAGNHDLVLDPTWRPRHPDRFDTGFHGDLDWGTVTYLEETSVAINIRGRTINIFGSPHMPRCGNFAFQYLPIRDYWANKVPEGTDVIVAHTPARGYRDTTTAGRALGCPWLLKEIWRVKPKLVVCGHVHEARGAETISFDRKTEVRDRLRMGLYPSAGDVLRAALPAGKGDRAVVVNAASTGPYGKERDVEEDKYVVVQI